MNGHPLLFALTCGFAALLAYSAATAWLSERGTTTRTLRAIHIWSLPVGLLQLVVQVLVFLGLWKIPALRWGWWQLVAGTTGNGVLGQSEVGGVFRITAIVLPVLFAFAVPREARAEEVLFRAGTEGRSPMKRLFVAVAFGAIHLLVGVPLAAAGSLIIAGGLYDLIYLRAYRAYVEQHGLTLTGAESEQRQRDYDDAVHRLAQLDGVDAASAQHAVTNWIIVFILFAALLGWL